MEELNKQQVVLLTLLVSIVTSIATGITTVSLVTQYETPTVTQTINRVVEKTIERVVPEEKGEKDPVTIVKTPEKEIVTVVVKEEDLTIDSVQTNEKSLVRIYEVASNGNRSLVSLAVVIAEDGSIMTRETFFNRKKSYVGVYGDSEYELDALYQGKDDPIIIMKPILEDEQVAIFSPAAFADAGALQLGQTVLSLGGVLSNEVNSGIVKSLTTAEDGVSITSVQTTVPAGGFIGTILINLKGQVVGMNLGQFIDTQTFTSVQVIQAYITNALTEV